MNPYLAGLLTVPLLAILVGLCAVAARGLLALAALGIAKVGRDSTDYQRRRVAAVVYGCRRARMLAVGDTAVVFIHGSDVEARSTALERLEPPPRPLSDFAAVARPGRKPQDPA